MTYRDLVIVSAVGAQVLAVGGCRVASVRRGWGCSMLDTAGSSRLQPSSVGTFRDTAEPVSQVGGASGKMCLRKGEITAQAVRKKR